MKKYIFCTLLACLSISCAMEKAGRKEGLTKGDFKRFMRDSLVPVQVTRRGKGKSRNEFDREIHNGLARILQRRCQSPVSPSSPKTN